MSSRTTIAILFLLTTMNIAALAVNVSLPSRAAIAGLSEQDLVRDADFQLAVKSVIEGCRVYFAVGKLKC